MARLATVAPTAQFADALLDGVAHCLLALAKKLAEFDEDEAEDLLVPPAFHQAAQRPADHAASRFAP
jgi:hypothetical protein